MIGAAMLAGAFVSREKQQNRDAPYDEARPRHIPVDTHGGLQAIKHLVQEQLGLMPSTEIAETKDPHAYVTAVPPCEAGHGYANFHFGSERGDVLWRADRGGRSPDAHRSWMYNIDASRFYSLGGKDKDHEEAINARVMSYRLYPLPTTY